MVKKAVEKWKEDEELQHEYHREAEKEKKIFKKQLRQFQKMGYYKKEEREEKDGEEGDEESEKEKKVRKVKKKKH